MTPWADLPAYRADYRARNPLPEPASIVAELAGRRQWLIWRYEPGETAEKKPRKVPYYASGSRRVGDQGSERDRGRLVDAPAALKAARSGDYDGIGFAFLPGDGLIGIDLDGMIDAETGEVAARLANIVAAVASYTEYSPSGKGVHLICAGESETFKSNKEGVEVFCGRQYFTFTARRWPGAPEAVRPIDAAVLKRLRLTVKGKRPAAAERLPPAAPAAGPGSRPAGPRQRSVAEEVALAESALATLDPDDYAQWIEIGMALKAGNLGQAGYVLWDAWSSRSAKYVGGEDTRKRWDGFKPDKVTLGTVYGLAEQGGWRSPWAEARERKRKREPRTAALPPPAEGGAGPPAGRPDLRLAGGTDVDGHATAEEGSQTPSGAGAGGGGDGGGPDRPFIPGLLFAKGEIKPCVFNIYQILVHDTDWAGVIAWDAFRVCTVKSRPPPYGRGKTGEWETEDDTRTGMWLAAKYGYTPGSNMVAEAVETLAKGHSFHPVRDWLAALGWDGEKRLNHWLERYCGVKRSAYSMRVAAWWLMGAVKRVLEPGCKFDYCLVLSGPQGKKKSSAFEVLAGEWFGDTELDLANKDAMSGLRGKLIYEFSELGALARSEERRQKSFLTRRVDEYRPVYGRREIKAPRQLVFAGTTNEHEWNKDPTGGRRFWPVDCEAEEIDIDGLRSVRDQLFAEAYVRVLDGERYWPTAKEQRQWFDPEQLKIEQPDALIDALHDYVFEMTRDFSLYEAAKDGLKLDASKLTRDTQTRCGIALRKLGCTRVEKRNGMTRFWYRPPARSEASDKAPAAVLPDWEDGDVAF